LPGARSVVVLGAGYARHCAAPFGGEPRGRITAMAVGEDYHITMRRHIDGLREALAPFGSFESYLHVDTGPLCERAFALRAGIGFRGRNRYVISPRFGTFFNLGLLITTLDIPADTPSTQTCAECGRCIAACPGGALRVDGFDYTRCISYISQKKGVLMDWEADLLGEAIYGCDICGAVCPHNRVTESHQEDIDALWPRVDSITGLTNAAFRERYGQTAMGWRGPAVMKRNAENAARVYKARRKGRD